jgi:hypothetical protein|tara:strand:+ start:6642 stop:6824 length:183 start_codon:yes stop_codon:yes gene_type:complete
LLHDPVWLLAALLFISGKSQQTLPLVVDKSVSVPQALRDVVRNQYFNVNSLEFSSGVRLV